LEEGDRGGHGPTTGRSAIAGEGWGERIEKVGGRRSGRPWPYNGPKRYSRSRMGERIENGGRRSGRPWP